MSLAKDGGRGSRYLITQEAQANLASLTDVVQRNPNSAEAYSTRGVAYAKIGKSPR